MEKWQKDHINKNLVELINNTNCDALLTSKLVSLQMLGRNDQEQLELPITPFQKAKTLYNILQTRKGAFEALMKCLEETKQTGALAILKAHNPHLQDHGLITKDENHIFSKSSSGVTMVYGGKFDRRKVAVKRVNHLLLTKLETPLKEVAFLKMLDLHKNIVGHFFTEVDDHFVYIALEQCKINLRDEIKMKVVNLPAATILKKCTVGLAYIHEHNIIHRNLNPRNVLISMVPEQVKISDFGLAQQIPAGESTVNLLEREKRFEWNAPEILTAAYEECATEETEVLIDTSSDIFSLGCIFHFVLSAGIHAFGQEGDRIYNIRHDKPQLKIGTSDEMWIKRVLSMISRSPENRPTAYEILSKYFESTMLDELKTAEKTNDVTPDLSVNSADNLNESVSDYLAPVLPNTNMRPTFGKITVDRNHVLGKKNTSACYKGLLGDNEVAVKVMSSSVFNPEKAVEEMDALREIKHKNLAQYFHIETDKDLILIAFELCTSNLHVEIKIKKSELKPDDTRMQCTAGLAYLHRNQIIHGNLNPFTILINEKQQVKISDYVLSMQIPKNISCVDNVEGWASPEVLNNISENQVPKMTMSSDVFSLGCIYYFIQTKGKHPFGEPGERNYNILHNNPQISDVINSKLMETIAKMITRCPDKRPLTPSLLSGRTYKEDPSLCRKADSFEAETTLIPKKVTYAANDAIQIVTESSVSPNETLKSQNKRSKSNFKWLPNPFSKRSGKLSEKKSRGLFSFLSFAKWIKPKKRITDLIKNQVHDGVFDLRDIGIIEYDLKQIVNPNEQNFVHEMSIQHLQIVKAHTQPHPSSLYIQRKLRDSNTTKIISEEEFIALTLDNKPVLICDTPGMGKSTLLYSLARRLRSRNDTKTIIAIISIPEFIRHLDFNYDLLPQLVKYILPTKMATKTLKKIASKGKTKLVVFLDEFDKIPKDKLDAGGKFLMALKAFSDKVKIYVVTRPHFGPKLEEILEVSLSYSIMPFDESNQIDFFKGSWKQRFPNDKVEEMKTWFHFLRFHTNISNLHNPEHHIFRLPVMCSLFVDSFSCTQDLKFPGFKRYFAEYREFVESRLNLSYDIVETTNYNVDHAKNNKSYHVWIAIKLLFPELAECYALHENINQSEIVDHFLPGILEGRCVHNPSFIHSSFADYFLAELFASVLLDNACTDLSDELINRVINYAFEIESRETTFVSVNVSGKTIYTEPLYNLKNEGIALFLNGFLRSHTSDSFEPSIANSLFAQLSADQLYKAIRCFTDGNYCPMLEFLGNSLKFASKDSIETYKAYIMENIESTTTPGFVFPRSIIIMEMARKRGSFGSGLFSRTFEELEECFDSNNLKVMSKNNFEEDVVPFEITCSWHVQD